VDLGLTGKVAIVTGATANIGRAIALELATEGVCLVAVGRDAEAGEKIAAQARQRGARDARFVAADLLDPAAPNRILAEAEKMIIVIAVITGGLGIHRMSPSYETQKKNAPMSNPTPVPFMAVETFTFSK
jgi:2-hydroxycyclohexanecarboxyl-CoA dehydrogenase